jgi:hypothetical protein
MQHLPKFRVLHAEFIRQPMSKSKAFIHTSLVGFVLLTCCVTSCSDPFTFWSDDVPGTVRLDLHLTWKGEPFALNQKGEDHNGHVIRLENLQMYLSRISLRDELSGEWRALGDVHLVDFSADHPFILEEVPGGFYDGIKFGLGIPPDLNSGIDPASYPNEHPLSVAGSAGMFWTWASGYIFVKYEGKFAPEGSGEPLEPLSYHTGTDSAYREVILDLPDPQYFAPRNLTVLDLSFDGAEALHGPLDSIDVVTHPVTHSAVGTQLGYRLMDLMDDAWSLH